MSLKVRQEEDQKYIISGTATAPLQLPTRRPAISRKHLLPSYRLLFEYFNSLMYRHYS